MERRFFQFLAGERKKEVVEFSKIEEEDGMVFVSFRDGSRCNEELILPLNDTNWTTELMAEISDPDNIWRFKEEWVGRQEEKWAENANGERVCVIPYKHGRKKVIPIPPKPAKSKFGAIESLQQVQPQQVTNQPQLNENDPVWVMLNKCRKYPTEIPMILTIALPTKSLYDVIKESFDNGAEKVIDFVINNIDDKVLKESLKKALLDAYEEEEDKPEEKKIKSLEPEAVEEPVIGSPQLAKNK